MQLLDYEHKISSRSESLNIWGLGDFHLGCSACLEKLLNTNIHKIKKDPNAVVFLLGDYADFINISDKRFDGKTIASWLTLKDLDNLAIRQCDKVIEYLIPIADKIIGGCSGNHETKILRKYHFDPTEYIITNLRKYSKKMIVNLGYGVSVCRVKIKRGRETRTIFVNVAHGSSGAITVGGSMNRIIKSSQNLNSDIILRGHTHQLTVLQQSRLRIPASGKLQIVDAPQILVQCGSYMRTYQEGVAGYGEVKEYLPSILGSPEIQIFPQNTLSYNVNLHTNK